MTPERLILYAHVVSHAEVFAGLAWCGLAVSFADGALSVLLSWRADQQEAHTQDAWAEWWAEQGRLADLAILDLDAAREAFVRGDARSGFHDFDKGMDHLAVVHAAVAAQEGPAA